MRLRLRPRLKLRRKLSPKVSKRKRPKVLPSRQTPSGKKIGRMKKKNGKNGRKKKPRKLNHPRKPK